MNYMNEWRTNCEVLPFCHLHINFIHNLFGMSLFFIWFVRLLALRPLLAYCASLGWQWRWLWRSRWNVDWQGKPMFSDKTCPSATFVHHKIPHDQTGVWTRAAAVGSRRLTAWAICYLIYYEIHTDAGADTKYFLSVCKCQHWWLYGQRGADLMLRPIYIRSQNKLCYRLCAVDQPKDSTTRWDETSHSLVQ
jgi:hypothetical protein